MVLYINTEFSKFNDSWSAEDKKKALAHHTDLESFEFLHITKEAAINLFLARV